jgi:hypothetical protein
LKNADYHAAIKKWLEQHKPLTVLCFVQFRDTEVTQMPRLYLATPMEIADRLRATAKGRGGTILYEHRNGQQERMALVLWMRYPLHGTFH